MTNHQLIIPSSQVIEIDDEFYPFNEVKDKEYELLSSRGGAGDTTLEDSQILSEQEEKISELKNEISFLERTKATLENDLRIRENSKSDLIAEEEKLKQVAQSEANKLIEEAKQQAEEIRKEGEQQKNDLLNEANKNKEEINKAAQKLGYKDGFEKGFAKGETEREEIEMYLKKILGEAIRKKDQIVESVREHLVDLVFTAVKKVVKNIIDTDRKLVLRNIVDSLKQIDTPIKLTIKVNYEDLKTSSTLKSQLLKSLKTLKQVEVLADPNVEKGGCIVETDFSIVDARISTQLEKIGNALNSMELTSRKK